MRAVLFCFVFVPQVFPLLLQFLQPSAVTRVGISLCSLSVRAAASSMARLLLAALGDSLRCEL